MISILARSFMVASRNAPEPWHRDSQDIEWLPKNHWWKEKDTDRKGMFADRPKTDG